MRAIVVDKSQQYPLQEQGERTIKRFRLHGKLAYPYLPQDFRIELTLIALPSPLLWRQGTP